MMDHLRRAAPFIAGNRQWPRITALLLLLFTPAPSSAFPLGGPWVLDAEEGFYRAQREQKNVLLVFHAEWSRPCLELERDLLENAAIKALIEPLIPVKVDYDVESLRARRSGVNKPPVAILYNSNGAELDRVEGYAAAPEFEAALRAALDSGQNFRGRLERARTQPGERERQRELLAELLRRGMGADGLNWIAELIRTAPEEDVEWVQELELLRISFYSRQRQLETALAALDEFCRKYPRHEDLEEVYFLKADCLIQLYQYDAARKVYQEFVEKFPTSPRANDARKMIEYTF